MRYGAESMIVGLIAARLLKGQPLRRVTESILIALFSSSILAGCSTQSAKTVETEKTVQYSANSDQSPSQPVVTEQRTTKSEEKTESNGNSTGLLSGTVHVVGEVLALPFRAVAGLINLAF